MSGLADRLIQTEAARLRRIDELVAYQRSFLGDSVREDRPLATIAELVIDEKFNAHRLRELLVSWKKQIRLGKNRVCEPGTYYLKIFEISAMKIGHHVRLVHPSRSNAAPSKAR